MSTILDAVRAYYVQRFREHGATPRGVDWNSAAAQDMRFTVLMDSLRADRGCSILDYGCGYGALATFLGEKEYGVMSYIGYDIAGETLEHARSRLCALPVCAFVGDLGHVSNVDYAVASGICNVKLDTPDDVWFNYLTGVWGDMHRLSTRAFAFNCLSLDSDAERRESRLFYADPEQLAAFCRLRYGAEVEIVTDYQLYEFTLVVRRSA